MKNIVHLKIILKFSTSENLRTIKSSLGFDEAMTSVLPKEILQENEKVLNKGWIVLQDYCKHTQKT